VYIIADNHFSVSTFPVVTVNRFSTKVLLASGISIALRIDQNTLLFKSLGSVKHFFFFMFLKEVPYARQAAFGQK